MTKNLPNNSIASKKNNDDLFSASLIFNQNIDELWLYLRDLSNEASNVDFLDEFKYIKGLNTWTVGNICSMYWVGVTHIKAKCKHIKIDRSRKKIKWKLKCDIGINYYRTLNLYTISQSGKTLVKVIIARTKKKNDLIDISQSLNYYLNLQFEILNQQSKYLESIKNDVILYESTIVNNYYKNIWQIISIKELSEITSDFVTNLEFKGSINEVGSFIKYYDKFLKKKIFLKVSEYDNSNAKKCWLFRLEAIGANINNIINVIEFKLIKINDFKTHISLLKKYSSKSDSNYINQCINNSKAFFKNIVKHIENLKNDFLNNKEDIETGEDKNQKINE